MIYKMQGCPDYKNSFGNRCVKLGILIQFGRFVVNNDHQNITLDHSFYLNYSLMDGYFTSGLGIGSEWDLSDPEEFEPGRAIYLFGILDCYPIFGMVNGSKQVMLKKSPQLASAGSDSQYRYQTLAGDLLVDGTFNINSTSVDAWASQLASLRGKPIEGLVVDDQTPVLRFQDSVRYRREFME